MEKQEEIVTNVDDIDIEELDRKFEMMSRECADSMTGTGTGLNRPRKKRKSTKGEESGFIYVESTDYFPKEIRKQCKIGEYAENAEDNK